MQEFVVPKSIPNTFAIKSLSIEFIDSYARRMPSDIKNPMYLNINMLC